MLDTLIILYIILFAFIAWQRFDLGLFFLFLFLPTYLIRFNIGPLPTTLLEVMIGVIFIVLTIQKIKKTRNQENKESNNLRSYILGLKSTIKNHYSLFLAITLFLSAATISIFTSINIRAALGEWKAFYIEPVLLFIILISLPLSGGHRGSLVEKILFALLLCGLATSILAIYQHFTGWMVPWEYWENRNTFRVTGWYGFPNGVGLFLAPLVPLAIYLIKQKLKAINNKQLTTNNFIILICSLFFVLCSIFAIFFAKSTGGLVGVVAGIGLLLIFWKRTRWTAIILSTICFFGILGLNDSNSTKQELLMQDRSGQIRLNMWAETTEFLSDNPIAGAGLASYKTLIYPYRIDKWIEVFHHPHNIFLTMWVNLGLLGLVGFVWILVWYYRVGLSRITYHITHNNLVVFLLASMTALMTTGLVDSPYIKNDLAVLFWLLIALMVATSSPLERGSREGVARQNQKNQLE